MAITRGRALRGAALRHAALRTATFALLAAGCTAPDAEPTSRAADTVLTVTDDAGRTVMLDAPARRVISLIPAQTEIVSILAGPGALIARTQWDTQPELAQLPSIGNALSPSIEWLAAQQPDLIIAWPDAQSRDVVRRLSDVGIPVYASRVESIAEIRSVITRLGVLLGASARADSLVQALDAQLDSVRARVAGRPPRSVLYLTSADPPMAAGPGTFIDELIAVAGGRNAFDDVRQLWAQVSLEEVVRRQPDIIIRPDERLLDDALADIRGRPGWRELRAVQQGRVHAVDPYIFNRVGAGIGHIARELALLIHPEIAQR